MATKTEEKPYLERKPFSVETTKEQLIYGGGDTLTELKETSEKKKQQMINEG